MKKIILLTNIVKINECRSQLLKVVDCTPKFESLILRSYALKKTFEASVITTPNSNKIALINDSYS